VRGVTLATHPLRGAGEDTIFDSNAPRTAESVRNRIAATDSVLILENRAKTDEGCSGEIGRIVAKTGEV
jgi:hypothetical protein